ncbi:MAG: DEAD/DEAH box helicase [Chloroflexi bacterium]|nr:DEAD/DEAH box helicase [Chloroflexota bacterium]
MNESGVSGLVSELEAALANGDFAGHVEHIEAREAQYRQPDADLHPNVKAAMKAKGALRTYSHQAYAIDAAMRGSNVVVSTSTASGKSICFHAPVLHTLLNDSRARALYLFPTKALGHDQLSGLDEMMKGGGIDLSCDTYDGDTPREDRKHIRASSRIIITNVDMMQVSMLPQHGAWRSFLSNLKYVVLDEAHYYRGVFGTHVAMIMRRLRRILRQYGASPQFILCSATIANPREHAERLVGLPFDVIDSDGSPSGSRAFILLDAASTEQKMGSTGINMQAAMVTSSLMRRNVKTLAFAQNRAGVERIVQYTEEYLNGRRAGRYRRPELKNKIRPYRAGYLADDRRAVERGLREGNLLAVASTNALELGVDIGSVSATVIAGYPGTIASSWQQAGRSGRNGKQSLSLMLLRDNPVDSFYLRFPQAFFGAAHESAQVNLQNENILGAHLECAAAELSLSRADFDIFGERALRFTTRGLVQAGRLIVDGAVRRLAPGIDSPAFNVNIRASDNDRFDLLNADNGRKLEETSRLYALRELYPGAVYAHKGQTYRVVNFDEGAREAYLSYLDQRIYTQAEISTTIRILEEPVVVNAGRRKIWTSRVLIRSQVMGYYERDLYTPEDKGKFFPVDMPALEYETMAAWFTGREPRPRYPDDGGALHAIAHVGTGALSMLAMCDRRDLGAIAVDEHPQLGTSAAFIFEEEMGGVGILDFVRNNPEALVQRMVDMVASCDCDEGCPSCIDSPFCSDDVEPPSKELMLDYFAR